MANTQRNPQQLFEDRLEGFISQIKKFVSTEPPGVYIATINDEFYNERQSFKENCMASIKRVKDADVAEEVVAATENRFDKIANHLRTKNERAHTMVMSYACKDRLGRYYFVTGPI